jgi:hypothetical protein
MPHAVRSSEPGGRRVDAPERSIRLRGGRRAMPRQICSERRVDPPLHRLGLLQGRAQSRVRRPIARAVGAHLGRVVRERLAVRTRSLRVQAAPRIRAAIRPPRRSHRGVARRPQRSYKNLLERRRYGTRSAREQHGSVLRYGHRGRRGARSAGRTRRSADLRVRCGRSTAGIAAPMFSVPIRAHVGGLLPARGAEFRAAGGGGAPCARNDCRRHSHAAGLLSAPVHAHGLAAADTGARAPEPVPGARGKGPVAGSHRSAVPDAR